MSVRAIRPDRRSVRRVRSLTLTVAALTLTAAACNTDTDDITDAGAIEFRDGAGPRVDTPERAMAMTVDAVETKGDDILVRVRVENTDDGYLDMGVEDTIYGPLLVMRDDRGNRYDSYAVEPAGVPGRRVADLSFRLIGPLDRDSTSFELELATQRGPLTTPAAPLPHHDGIRWRIDDQAAATPTSAATNPVGSEPIFAAAPRLPDLIHFWLETDPLPADR